ncbi:hypothetical protein [Pengzhenrongella sp.]|jgi:hypothetical protein|uniref:hypothetical protein n=1 Tax=Pengzhenrongella sp. TaxID=2888820 RepID=UPI0039C9B660
MRCLTAGPRGRAGVAAGPAYGWTLLFPERHPYAGGAAHYAAYLENSCGFEVELVADPPDAGPKDLP